MDVARELIDHDDAREQGARIVAPTPGIGADQCFEKQAEKRLDHGGERGIPGEALVERKSVVAGKSVAVLVALGGRRFITTKPNTLTIRHTHDAYHDTTCVT